MYTTLDRVPEPYKNEFLGARAGSRGALRRRGREAEAAHGHARGLGRRGRRAAGVGKRRAGSLRTSNSNHTDQIRRVLSILGLRRPGRECFTRARELPSPPSLVLPALGGDMQKLHADLAATRSSAGRDCPYSCTTPIVIRAG